MVSDELLLVIYPMNSTDIGSSRVPVILACTSNPERQAPGVDPRRVVLRRMNAPAQYITIVSFERVGTRQAVIAGQRQRILDHRNRVVRDRELDDVGFGRIELDAVIVVPGKAFDQARVDSQPRAARATPS